MKYVIFSLVITLLLSQLGMPQARGEELTSPSYWADNEILVNTELTINVVFISNLSIDEDLLKESLREVLPWYAPYISKEKRFVGLNFSEISLRIYQAPPSMGRAFAEYIRLIDREFFDPDKGERIISEYEDRLFQILGSTPRVYWADAWLVENWLYEKGPEYIPEISPDEYTIYFITSYQFIDGVVEYFVDAFSPETSVYFLEGGMIAFGGLHRLYFMDLTSIPLGSDKCGDEPGCKSATIDYYPSLLLGDLTYEDLAIYIAETIIYIFFRGYLYQPIYEINFYNYFLIIDATSNDEATEILSDFSTEYVRSALNRLYIYSYMITETRVVDVDEYPQLRQALFSTLTRIDDQLIVDCETVPDIVFNLPIIKRLESVRTIVTVLFVFDEEAYVCDSDNIGVALDQGAFSAISDFILRVRGPSTTLYHEAAHVLGLLHPHDADPYPFATELENWLYDWSATPMTYCSACRLRIMTEGEYFAQIDFDSIDLGITLDMMRRSRKTVFNALMLLEDIGASPPPGLELTLGEIDRDLKKAAEEIRKFNFFSFDEFYGIGAQKASAFDYAFSALQKALTASRSVEMFTETLIEENKLRSDLTNAMADLKTLRDEIARLEEEVKRLEATSGEVERLRASLASLENEKQSLSQKLVQAEGDASSLRGTVTLLTVLTIILAAAVVVTAVLSLRRGRRPPPPPPLPQMGPA